MKKTIFSIIIIIIAVGAVTGLTIWSKKHVPVAPVPNPVTTSDESKYLVTKEPQMVSVAEDAYLFGIGGSYPQFAQADASFNKKIADTITAGVTDFKTSVNADYQARLATGGDAFQKEFAEGGMYAYEVITDVVQSNDSYISTVIHVEGYSGGAHGFHGVMTFNYDVKNKRELHITDFGTLEDFSEFARNELKEKFLKDGNYDANVESMMRSGTDPKNPENFQNFTFITVGDVEDGSAEDTVTLYFGEYQVAPYVYGEQMVVAPISTP